MKLNAKSLALTGGIVWALIVFLIGVVNLLFSGYGAEFLKLIDSIYPGYTFGKWGFLGVLVGSIYAFVDVFIIAFVFAWIYNKLSKN
ncbi:MAG: hypothetical protein MUP70_03495 [Candidatus Aminicenantes bacterium]|nr:hypothetical protein [Candidatus Aminicenantes bacterium]